jgi:hypothetical protein
MNYEAYQRHDDADSDHEEHGSSIGINNPVTIPDSQNIEVMRKSRR